MEFPVPLSRRSIATFLLLVAAGIAEVFVAVPSWNIIYPFIRTHLAFLDSFFAASEQFASGTAIFAAVLVVCIQKPELRRTVGAFLVAMLIATTVSTTIKYAAGRARPNYGVRMGTDEAALVRDYLKDHDNPVLKPVRGDYWLWFSKDRPGLEPFRFLHGEFNARKLQPFGEYDSFPSGHAVSVMVLAAYLAILFPESRIVWYLVAVGCALARIRFRRHHPADVIVGSAIGWFSVCLAFSWYWPFRIADRVLARIGAERVPDEGNIGSDTIPAVACIVDQGRSRP